MTTQLRLFTILILGGLLTWSPLVNATTERSPARNHTPEFLQTLQTTSVSKIQSLEGSCPADYPLDCANDKCCPAEHTLYCPQLDPKPCINPSKLSDEQLKTLADNCSPLLSCH